jgi:hypothetical protein
MFPGQHAAVTLVIDNKDESFPVHGRVHLFDEDSATEALDKWVNNQHSDALFVDAAKPTHSEALPDGVCTVIRHEQIGTEAGHGPKNGEFKVFKVEFAVKDHEAQKRFKLPAFKDHAKVLVAKSS